MIIAVCALLLNVVAASELCAGSDRYSDNTAKKFLNYSRAAFCNSSSLALWDCGPVCDALPHPQGNIKLIGPSFTWGIQGYVAAVGDVPNTGGKKQCVLAFRGEYVARNYINYELAWDTDWPQWDGAQDALCPQCKVHRGFAGAYGDIRQNIFSAVDQLGCAKVDISGHGIGGAMAVLATLDLRRSQGVTKVGDVWTFGKPRVGNDVFVEEFVRAAAEQGVSPASWRVVRAFDPMPRWFPYVYVHEPCEVYLSEDTSSHLICDSTFGNFENQSDQCTVGNGFLETIWDYAEHDSYYNLSTYDKGFGGKCGKSSTHLTAFWDAVVMNMLLLFGIYACKRYYRKRQEWKKEESKEDGNAAYQNMAYRFNNHKPARR